MGLGIEVAIDPSLQSPSPSKRSERWKQEPLNGSRRPPEADLPAIAGGGQRAEQRRRVPLGIGMPIGAEPPGDEDHLLEVQRRLDANAHLHLAVTGIPPPMPRPRLDNDLLSRSKRALLSVAHERDPPRPNLEVLDAVVVHMLATWDEAAPLDGEVEDGSGAAALLSGLDEHDLLAGQRIPDGVTRAHRTTLRRAAGERPATVQREWARAARRA